jgi:hypothetical protein
MGEFIIVWRNTYREPFIQTDSRGFKDLFSTYESAKEEAEKVKEAEGPRSEWYFDYSIYEEVEN